MDDFKSARLAGFCDASTKAYAAVVYLKLEFESQTVVRFLAAKTRVCPLKSISIPRLELLSALLLSKLILSIQAALQLELPLSEPVCYTDSRVVLYWIQGCNQEWKQFVENRVVSIRAAVHARNWRHCPGKDNPADIPSRGMNASELSASHMWVNGPEWLWTPDDPPIEMNASMKIPKECQFEMKAKSAVNNSLVTLHIQTPNIGCLIECERFSSLSRLFGVTALVFKFIRVLDRCPVLEGEGKKWSSWTC